MSLHLDTEVLASFQQLASKLGPLQPPKLHDVNGRRLQVEQMQKAMGQPNLDGVEQSNHFALTKDGFQIPIHRIAKADIKGLKPTSAIVHYHGGGLISGSSGIFVGWLAQQVEASSVPIFSVNYRLAPEYQFPVPVEDCYTALTWVQQHASEFNIDPARIAVLGDSAGGGLAAAVTILARDRNLVPSIAKQILLCPMLDDRNVTLNPAIEPFAFWKNEDNITGWTAYLGDNIGTEIVPPSAAASRLTDFTGLPPTYIDVGTLDIFRDECAAFAAGAAAANVDVEFHLFPNVPHAFEHLAPESGIVKLANCIRSRAYLTF